MKKRWSNSKSIKCDESQILGRGCEGTVVFNGHFNDKPCAVKRVLLANSKQQVERELEALLHLNHPRIVQLFYFEKDVLFLRLALELCVGTLDDYCKDKYTGPMPEEIEALKQMLEGLAFIHSRKFVHRDVKPNNILISQSGELKIADFGFSKVVKEIDRFSMSVAGVGTGGWMAPELLKSITDVEKGGKAAAHATTAIDVFPLGCVFYYYITKGLHPFGNPALRNGNILLGQYNLSKIGKRNILRGLIKEMISAQPEERPKLDEILTRPIFNANDISSDELLKDDTKFAVWLKTIKNQFSYSNKKNRLEKKKYQQHLNTDECDSPGPLPRLPLNQYNVNTLSAARLVKTNLQVVDEECNASSTDGLKNLPAARPKAYSLSATQRRTHVSSTPPTWQRTLPRNRHAIFYRSEYYADEDEEDSGFPSNPIGLRAVASMTNLEPGYNISGEIRFSNHSLASSASSKTGGSLLSLGRSFIGDLFNKSV